MQFDSLAAFLAMEGHGVFVWSVYGVTLVVLVTLVVIPWRRNQQFFIQESMRLRREQADKNAAAKS